MIRIENITQKQSELFLSCWEHNLDWGETFLKEYLVTKAGFGKGYGIKLVFSYGMKQAHNLVKTCKEEYNYDITEMIKDAKDGKFPVALPIRLISKVIRGRSRSKNQDSA